MHRSTLRPPAPGEYCIVASDRRIVAARRRSRQHQSSLAASPRALARGNVVSRKPEPRGMISARRRVIAAHVSPGADQGSTRPARNQAECHRQADGRIDNAFEYKRGVAAIFDVTETLTDCC